MARTTTFAAVALVIVGGFVARIVPIGVTDGAWTDSVLTSAQFGSGQWSVSGSATGSALTTTLSVAVLLSGSIGPVGPTQSSTASQAAPGPASASAGSVSSPGLVLGVVGGSASASGVTTAAAYSPTTTSSSAAVTSVNLGLSALGVSLLSNLVTTTSVGPGGTVGASTQCASTGPTTASTSSLTDLRLASLGGTSAALTVVGNTGTASATQVDGSGLAQVSVSTTVTRVVSAVSAPSDPSASAQLTESVSVTLQQRATTLLGFLTTLTAAFTVVLVNASCATHL